MEGGGDGSAGQDGVCSTPQSMQSCRPYKFPAFSVSTPLIDPPISPPPSPPKLYHRNCTASPTDRSSVSNHLLATSLMEMRAAGEAPPTQQQLPPGFRFHPTDLELVLQYLRRMALDRPLPAAVIPVVHAAAMPDPWDLPGASEGESAYFFSLRQGQGRGGRRRRAASGYWKATGKEKPVFVQLPGPSGCGGGKRLLVGVKTALAFHRGKATPSSRADWVMHEYRLAGAADQNKRANDDLQRSEWVVCRVSLKSRARRTAAGGETTGDHQQQPSPSPSSTSSCVTDHTCHAPDQKEVSSQQQPRR